jgi:hypothetical protein
MKKERQIGIRVGVPAFFALELEDMYRHKEGAHRALAFPDFVGLLVGMGLEQYRKENCPAPIGGETAPEDTEEKDAPEGDPLHLFDMAPENLHDLFREFDEVMEPLETARLHLVHTGELA